MIANDEHPPSCLSVYLSMQLCILFFCHLVDCGLVDLFILQINLEQSRSLSIQWTVLEEKYMTAGNRGLTP